MKSLIVLALMLPLVACGKVSPSPSQSATPVVPSVEITPAPSAIRAVTSTVSAAATTTVTCTPTIDDGLSPSYKPDAPVRSVVGHGHVLSGVVRSSLGCTPVANVKIELWPEYQNLGHPNEARSTIFTDSQGRYRFECNLPEHIHMRISAAGYRSIAQNSYHPNGQAEGTFDIVLAPESP